jgi:putative ATPase
MDLFRHSAQRHRTSQPLAERMRPTSLEEFVGQPHLLGPGKLLARVLAGGELPSLILWGPPGTGKTTLARILTTRIRANFAPLSAVMAGVREIREVVAHAAERRDQFGERTILFIDEIHRFSKAQQDALLHAVEDGLVTLIGATTENPYFEVISPLISRAELLRFLPLDEEALLGLLDRALVDESRGLAAHGVAVPPAAKAAIARAALGDARRALTLLERAVLLAEAKGRADVDTETLDEAAQRKLLLYDKDADAHYDTISAFIKSLRGSDPDAALYYLAVMLSGGEDPKFVARRLLVFASEDIGNADPRALEIAVAVARAVEFVGLPECRINLAQAVTYLALAPKSNASYEGIERTLREIEENGALAPPAHLRDAHYRGARALGHGVGYVYPHDEGGYVDQEHLPEALRGQKFYQPTDEGEEARLGRFLREMRERRSRRRQESG